MQLKAGTSILKYWPVAALMLFIVYFTASYVDDVLRLPHYHQDCTCTLSNLNQANPGQPCVYKQAVASLHNIYDHRGRLDSQGADLTFPDGTTLSMNIDGIDGKINYIHTMTTTQVNGPCQVEIWHGIVTAIFVSGHKINSVNNPDDAATPLFGILLLLLTAGTAAVWVRIKNAKDSYLNRA